MDSAKNTYNVIEHQRSVCATMILKSTHFVPGTPAGLRCARTLFPTAITTGMIQDLALHV
jgi:hypothetical protein